MVGGRLLRAENEVAMERLRQLAETEKPRTSASELNASLWKLADEKGVEKGAQYVDREDAKAKRKGLLDILTDWS